MAAVPVFLSAAGHTADDIPKCIATARQKFADLPIDLTRHVGSHANVAKLSALRYEEAVADRAPQPAERTIVVLAAHGSPEPETFEELERFAAARQTLTPGVRIVPCFSQMGVPRLKDVLPGLARSSSQSLSQTPSPPAPLPKGEGRKRIVVQPHFLLKGRLVDAIAFHTAAVAEQFAKIEWIVAEPLGCHRLLAEAVLELGMVTL